MEMMVLNVTGGAKQNALLLQQGLLDVFPIPVSKTMKQVILQSRIRVVEMKPALISGVTTSDTLTTK
jgi:hypothetical protein